MTSAYSKIGREITYPLEEIQFVVPIRCGDARDGSKLETEILDTLSIEYAARGVKIRVARVNMAGSVVNLQSYVELKNILKGEIRETSKLYDGQLAVWERLEEHILFIPTVQISGHANISFDRSETKMNYKPSDVTIADEHSPVNCGMSHIGEVWHELADLLLDLAPSVNFFDKTMHKQVDVRLDSVDTLHRLLVSTYLHEGHDVKSFLEDISILDQPLKSKSYLRMQVDRDLELARLPLHINASLIDYGQGLEVRIDDNEHVHTILDDVAGMMAYVMDKLPSDHNEKKARGSIQKPVCGIICPSDIPKPRDTVINYLNQIDRSRNLDVAGSAFLSTGNDLYNQFASFGPYKMGGIAYSVAKLGIKDYYIVAKSPLEADIIEIKIRNDPILSVLFECYQVKITKLTLPQIEATGIQKHSNNNDRDVLDLIASGVNDFPRHKLSVLNRPIKEQRVRELLRGA